MPYRSYRRPMATFLPRKKPRFEWVHDTFNNVTPAAVNLDDLLGNFKAQYAISANFPEIVIWRLHIRFSVRVGITTNAANDGVLCTCFVDSTKQTIVNQATNPNDEHYLIYKQLYATQVAMNGGTVGSGGAVGLFEEWDVKAHRKLVNINDSLLFQTSFTGSVTPTDYSVSFAALLKMP